MRRITLAGLLTLAASLSGCVGVGPPPPPGPRWPAPMFPPGPWEIRIDLSGLGALLLLVLLGVAGLILLGVAAFAGTGPWNRVAAGALVGVAGFVALAGALALAVLLGLAGSLALARRPSGAT